MEYRLFFLDGKGAIQAREEFVAPNDDAAIVVSEAVCHACSDLCTAYELWAGARLVGRMERPGSIGWIIPTDGQATAAQETVLDLEDRLQRSHWSIAKSLKLLEAMAKLNKQAGASR